MRAGGVRAAAGPEAAADIEREFREERPWHRDVTCSFAGGVLTLVATNDYDSQGRALSDEFSDCIAAYLRVGDLAGDAEFGVVGIEII
jgi:hypothetical protein